MSPGRFERRAGRRIALLVLGLAPLAGAATAQPFSPVRTIFDPNQVGFETIAVVDVDRDGDRDVVAVRLFQDSLEWYENRRDGTFPRHVIASTGDGPKGVAAGDLDGDGDVDFAAAAGLDDQVAWYRNDGAQEFTERVVSATADGASDVEIADLDGDGALDLIAGSPNDGRIVWYRNAGPDVQGELQFEGLIVLDEPFQLQDVDLAIADVDRDGAPDIVAGLGFTDDVVWFANLGNGAFDDRIVASVGDYVTGVEAGDLDGDGDVDLLSASLIDDTIAAYRNDGTGVFVGEEISTVEDGALSARLADLDGDGDLDVLSCSFLDDRVAWFENHGDGGFTPRLVASGIDAPRFALPADLDGDGDLDVVVSSAGRAVWFENLRPKGTAQFPDAELLGQEAGSGPSGVATGDLDGDGGADVVAAVLFATTSDQVAFRTSAGLAGVVAAGDGQFVEGVNGVELHDLDGDGDLDVLTAAAIGGDIAWHENLETPTPSFAPHLVDGGATGTRHATAGDVDGDGDLDLVAAVGGGNAIRWYPGDGAGGFGSGLSAAAGVAGARSVELRDFDLDGDLDIAFGEPAGDSFDWLRNEGGSPPSFTRVAISNPAGATFWVESGDWNGDGRPDILSTSFAGDEVTFWHNTGSTFAPATIFEGIPGATGLALADADSDGDLDAFVASRDGDRVVWIENLAGPASVGVPAAIVRPLPPILDGALALVAGDLDGDGTIDLLVASEAGGRVDALPNVRALFWDDFEGGSPDPWSGVTP